VGGPGVVVCDEPPPQPETNPRPVRKTRIESQRSLGFLIPLNDKRQTKTPASASVLPDPEAPEAGKVFMPVFADAVVVMVAVVVTAAPLGVTLLGANVHDESEGNPEQAKVTAWLNPLAGVTVRVVLPVEPAVTVIALGLAETEKSGATAAPDPESATVCGLPVALSAMEIDAVRAPDAVGLKVTLMVQLAAGATFVPQVLV
jgi:hypothetical protein